MIHRPFFAVVVIDYGSTFCVGDDNLCMLLVYILLQPTRFLTANILNGSAVFLEDSAWNLTSVEGDINFDDIPPEYRSSFREVG